MQQNNGDDKRNIHLQRNNNGYFRDTDTSDSQMRRRG